MKTIEVTRYETTDGQIFDDEHEAMRHQAVLHNRDRIENYVEGLDAAGFGGRTCTMIRNHLEAFVADGAVS